jgi:hypothetical protein
VGSRHQLGECEDRQAREQETADGRAGRRTLAERGPWAWRADTDGQIDQAVQSMQAMKPPETLETEYRWEHCQEKTKADSDWFVLADRHVQRAVNGP